MEREFILKKTSKNDVFIDNIFYGREVRLTFSCDGIPFEVEICRQDTRFSAEIKLTIGHYPCSLFLETLPPLAIFSKAFEGIDFFSVSEDIRLLVFQAAAEAIQKHFSNILGTAISIDSVDQTAANEPSNGLDFAVTSKEGYRTGGSLVAPKEVLVLLAKKIQNTPTLHNFRKLEALYRFCVGSTQLSKEAYRDLREEDVVFLDQYELAKAKKVDIVGLDGLKISGMFGEEGIIVEQIAQTIYK
ncbi:MAG: hypothetical protein LBR92_02650 [Puniceicoccales bacterium]|jgi:hypothetical protein|nr:hypothetical protein [Puniceicoccales bacterium]